MKPKYQKGEIVSVDLGLPPEAIKGHEQAKERPCMILRAFEGLQLAIIIPFTSKKHPDYFYTIVHVAQGTGGLIADSYLLCHQIRTVSYKRIGKSYGQLPIRDISKVNSVLSDTLDL